jgi:hypothetical protein
LYRRDCLSSGDAAGSRERDEGWQMVSRYSCPSGDVARTIVRDAHESSLQWLC